MKLQKSHLFGAAALLTTLAAFLWYRFQPAPVFPEAPEFTNVQVGLGQEESRKLHHIYQGSNLFPLALIFALHDEKTGRPIAESFEDYGFLLEKPSTENPYGLPVGLGADEVDFLGMKTATVGLNCSACHTGELHYNGKRLRIDGAPNLIDVEGWTLNTAANAEKLLTDPLEALAFVARFLAYQPPGASSMGKRIGIKQANLERLRAAAQTTQELELVERTGDDFLEDVVGEFRKLHGKLQESGLEKESFQIESIRGLPSDARKVLLCASHLLKELKRRINFAVTTVEAIKRSPVAGPGRDDAWNLVSLTVMKEKGLILDQPIVIPPLFYNAQARWFHSDGNTNSVMDRNLAQGIALGVQRQLEFPSTTIKIDPSEPGGWQWF